MIAATPPTSRIGSFDSIVLEARPEDNCLTRSELEVILHIDHYIASEGFLSDPPCLRAGLLSKLQARRDKAMRTIIELRTPSTTNQNVLYI